MGIEPTSLAWEARVLPLDYARVKICTEGPKNDQVFLLCFCNAILSLFCRRVNTLFAQA